MRHPPPRWRQHTTDTHRSHHMQEKNLPTNHKRRQSRLQKIEIYLQLGLRVWICFFPLLSSGPRHPTHLAPRRLSEVTWAKTEKNKKETLSTNWLQSNSSKQYRVYYHISLNCDYHLRSYTFHIIKSRYLRSAQCSCHVASMPRQSPAATATEAASAPSGR